MSDTALKPASPELLAQLAAVVGPKGWIADAADMAPYLADWRGLYHGQAAAVLRPATTAEVSRIVRLCAEARVGIVPQGGNTGLVGGSVPGEQGGEVLVNLGRMNRVRALDALDHSITVEAGCILAEVQQAADEADRLFPLSLGAEGRCQIGGNLSTNAGGTAVLRYGTTRELVLGLEVVLPDGQVWDGLRALRKDNTGYDLKQLFIGAEGTLGIITAAVLKLFPKPRETATAFAALPDLDAAVDLFARFRAASSDLVTSFELIPGSGLDLALKHVAGTVDPLSARHAQYLLIELASGTEGGGLADLVERTLAAGLEAGTVLDATLARNAAQAAALWRVREAMVEAQRLEGASIKHDVSVPVSAIPAFVARASKAVERAVPGVRPIAFGHVGDGNVHFNLTQPEGMDGQSFLARWGELSRIVHDIVADFGGSISAEHGLGRLKCHEILRYRSPVEIELMRTLKRALDPHGIMNPGKVVLINPD